MDTRSYKNTSEEAVPLARPVAAHPIKPVDNDKWGLSSAIKVLLLVGAAEIGVSTVFFFVAGFTRAVVNPEIGTDTVQSEQATTAIALGPSAIAGQLLGFWIVYYEVTRRRGLRFIRALDLDQWRTGRLFGFGIMGLALSWFSGLFSQFVPPPDELPIDDFLVLAESGLGGTIMVIATFLLAPFVEEIVFRGFVYPGFKRKLGVIGGGLLVSILFVGLHLFTYGFYWPAILTIGVVSIVLVGIREWSGSLSYCIIFHLGYNLPSSFGLLVT